MHLESVLYLGQPAVVREIREVEGSVNGVVLIASNVILTLLQTHTHFSLGLSVFNIHRSTNMVHTHQHRAVHVWRTSCSVVGQEMDDLRTIMSFSDAL